MPARKPVGLHERHSTRAELDARVASEAAMQPDRGLPANEPARLEGHKIAAEVWRRLIREYNKLEATIVSRLDMDLLVDYCILMEQLNEIDGLRNSAYNAWSMLGEQYQKLIDQGNAIEALSFAEKIVSAFDAIVKLDSRADRKRDMLLKIRQSLYLTPRARAGSSPKDKEDKPPEDPFERLLNKSLVEAREKDRENAGGLGDEE